MKISSVVQFVAVHDKPFYAFIFHLGNVVETTPGPVLIVNRDNLTCTTIFISDCLGSDAIRKSKNCEKRKSFSLTFNILKYVRRRQEKG